MQPGVHLQDVVQDMFRTCFMELPLSGPLFTPNLQGMVYQFTSKNHLKSSPSPEDLHILIPITPALARATAELLG